MNPIDRKLLMWLFFNDAAALIFGCWLGVFDFRRCLLDSLRWLDLTDDLLVLSSRTSIDQTEDLPWITLLLD